MKFSKRFNLITATDSKGRDVARIIPRGIRMASFYRPDWQDGMNYECFIAGKPVQTETLEEIKAAVLAHYGEEEEEAGDGASEVDSAADDRRSYLAVAA